MGIYTTIKRPDYQVIRFLFTAHFQGEPVAGSDIRDVRWFTFDEFAQLSDAELVGAEQFRRILEDIAGNRHYPLTLFSEPG